MFTQRAALEEILKNFEAKSYTPADVQFFFQIQVKNKKKVITSADVQFSTKAQRGAVTRIVFDLIHVTCLYICKCPRAARNGFAGCSLPTPGVNNGL